MAYYKVIRETITAYDVLVEAENEERAITKAKRKEIIRVVENSSSHELIIVECDKNGEVLK